MRKSTRRLAAALVLSALALTGCSLSEVWDRLPVIGHKVDPQAEIASVFGPVEQQVEVAGGLVLLSAVQEGVRQLGFVTVTKDTYSLIGTKQTIVENAASAKVKLDGDLVVVESLKKSEEAPEATPQYAAYHVSGEGLKPVDYYALKAPEAAVKTGHFLLVNKGLNVLWHYRDGKMVKAYRVATGRQTGGPEPTWEDYKTNFFTPEGTFTLTNFVQNPSYTALKPGDKSYAGGAPGNPLGTRWMGFEVLKGDNAWIWGIHGTSHPEAIGTWASDGCIRMFTQEAEELFDQLKGKNPTLQVVKS